VRSAADILKRVLTRTFAAPARLGANPAVLVLILMSLALLRAATARRQTHLQLLAKNVFVRSCPARCQRTTGETYISAVEIQSNALTQLRHHILRQTGIGATRAHLRAAIAFFNATDQRLADIAAHVGVG
jgi:hypothetical protein